MMYKRIIMLPAAIAAGLVALSTAASAQACHDCPAPGPVLSAHVSAPSTIAGAAQVQAFSETVIPYLGRAVESGFNGPSTATSELFQLNPGHIGAAAGDAPSQVQTWFGLSGSQTDDTHVGAASSIGSVAGSGGLQMNVNPALLIGLSYAFNGTMGSAGALNSSSQSRGFGPYAGFRLDPHWNLFAAGGYNWINNNLSSPTGVAGGGAGGFNGNSWYVNGGVNGTMQSAGWSLSPTASVLYNVQTNDPYADTAGAAVAGSKSRLGRVSFGGSAGYPMQGWTPFLRGAIEADFVHPNPISTVTGTAISPSAVGGVLGGGINLTLSPRMAATIDASYDTIGRSQLSGWSARARLTITF